MLANARAFIHSHQSTVTAIGLLGLAVYQASTEDFASAGQSLVMAALSAGLKVAAKPEAPAAVAPPAK